MFILHLSHLSIDIILEATATTIVQFEQNDILQFDTLYSMRSNNDLSIYSSFDYDFDNF